MDDDGIGGTLAFLALAERLKDTLRNGRTASGRTESTAEHTWRLCLLALVLGDELGVDTGRLLKVCLVHDLAEALTGDLPAPAPRRAGVKEAREREALGTLTATLPSGPRQQILALWEEYETGATPEGRLARGLDKLETILQHAQGVNPPEFDLAYNLDYGRKDTDAHPLLAALRDRLDAATRARLKADASAPTLPGTP
ncbi:HD domain-containing protein [Falsiroseomonas oryzae]|uniref:HD domain-containing protein n=1 Tax=Falsiroseomonas oryzae TaxID=2766473 RepID=UPI0022EB9CC9|nr:HD domain-containing protein [Roseomonas sp. MO-31]